MERIAEFEKVSFENFEEAMKDAFPGISEIREIYDGICLPRRATSGSAGYDFFLTADIALAPGETVKIPTGIRARMEEGWVLLLYPRSGLGFKFRLQLNNTVGVIDSDYAWAENEGHIITSLRNPSDQEVIIRRGERFCQGVLVPFGTAEEEEVSAERKGGFGSTGS